MRERAYGDHKPSPPLPDPTLLSHCTRLRGICRYIPIFILYFDFSLSFLYLQFAPFQFFSFLSSLFPFHPSLHISSIFRTDVPRLTSRCNRSNSLIARVDFPPNRKAPYFIYDSNYCRFTFSSLASPCLAEGVYFEREKIKRPVPYYDPVLLGHRRHSVMQFLTVDL